MRLSQEDYQKVFVQTKAITQAQFDGLSQTKEARQIGSGLTHLNSQYAQHIFLVPSSVQTLAFDTGFDGHFLF